MGGGTRKIKEARRAPIVVPRTQTGGGAGGGGGRGEKPQIPVCEREQRLAIRIDDGAALEVGEQIGVVRGMPLAVVAGGKAVGSVTDRRQSAMISGCLDAGYLISGRVTMVDDDRGEALAVVAGVKARE